MAVQWYQWPGLPQRIAIEDGTGGRWEGEELRGTAQKPHVDLQVDFGLVSALCTQEEVTEIIRIGKATLAERVQRGDSRHIDSVDGWPTFEWHPMTYGNYDRRLEHVLRPIVETRLTPYVRRRFNVPEAVACTALFRRYVDEERRVHPVHFDHQSFATAVVGLNPGEFEGGLFVQGDITRGPDFIALGRGDVVVHQYDLHHGVRVTAGARYSLIFWFMDTRAACLQNTRFWYRSAAEAGVPDAMCNWAACLEQGDGSGQAPSFEAALPWYERAIALGHVQSMNNLAKILWEGEAVPTDVGKAVALWQRSAEGGYTTAQRNLGSVYLTGGGGRVPVNVYDGLRLLKLAAEKGDIEASFKLGYHGRASKDAGLVRYLRRAADLGHPHACSFIADMYRLGEFGFPRDLASTAQYLRWAAHLDVPEAMNNLGRMYCTGEGVDADGAKAAALFRRAADLDDPSGKMNLALCYQRGVGVGIDLVEALIWCRRAAAQKHGMAEMLLPQLEASANVGVSSSSAQPDNDEGGGDNNDHPPRSHQELRLLGVKDLKRLLAGAGWSSRGCLDKTELIALAARALGLLEDCVAQPDAPSDLPTNGTAPEGTRCGVLPHVMWERVD